MLRRGISQCITEFCRKYKYGKAFETGKNTIMGNFIILHLEMKFPIG